MRSHMSRLQSRVSPCEKVGMYKNKCTSYFKVHSLSTMCSCCHVTIAMEIAFVNASFSPFPCVYLYTCMLFYCPRSRVRPASFLRFSKTKRPQHITNAQEYTIYNNTRTIVHSICVHSLYNKAIITHYIRITCTPLGTRTKAATAVAAA